MSRAEFLQRPDSDRPRERLMFLGPEQLSDEELLALVLGYGGGGGGGRDRDRGRRNY